MSTTSSKRMMTLATIIGIVVAVLFAVFPAFRASSDTTVTWPADSDPNWQVTGTNMDGTNSTVEYQVKDGVLFMKPTSGDVGTFDNTNSLLNGNVSAFAMIAISNSGITTIAMKGTLKFPGTAVNMDKSFSNTEWNCFQDLTDVSGLSHLDTSNVTSMSQLFYGDAALTSLKGLETWDVSHVTLLSGAFGNCKKLSDISALSGWKTSKVATLHGTFASDTTLADISALSGWDTAAVTDMSSLFFSDGRLSSLSPLATWNTGSVITLEGAFRGCSSITNLDGLQEWSVSNVRTLKYAFYGDGSLADISALKNWKTTSLTDLSYTFGNHRSLMSLSGLENWDTSHVTTLQHTFYTPYSSLPSSTYHNVLADISELGKWDVRQVSDMDGTFYDDDQLDDSDFAVLAKWKTPALTQLTATFFGCTGIENISYLKDWDVSHITQMSDLFNGCTSLSDITALANWNTGKVTSVLSLFSGDTSLHDLSSLQMWDLSAVTGVGGMLFRVDWYRLGVPAADKGRYRPFYTTSGRTSSNIDHCTENTTEKYANIFQGGTYSYDAANNTGSYDDSTTTYDKNTAAGWYSAMQANPSNYTARVYLRPATLKIKKTVKGEPKSTQTFSVKVTLANRHTGTETYGNSTYGTVDFTNGVATVQVTAGQAKKLTELPPTAYTVTEPADKIPAGYKFKSISPADAQDSTQATGTLKPHNNVINPIDAAPTITITNIHPTNINLTLTATTRLLLGESSTATPIDANAYQFTLCEVKTSGSATTCEPVSTPGNDASKQPDDLAAINFGSIPYTKAGTHTYRLSQVTGSDSMIDYDKTVYTLKVAVTDPNDDGKLSAAVTGEKQETDPTSSDTSWNPDVTTSSDTDTTNITVSGALFTNRRKLITSMPATGGRNILLLAVTVLSVLALVSILILAAMRRARGIHR